MTLVLTGLVLNKSSHYTVVVVVAVNVGSGDGLTYMMTVFHERNAMHMAL